MLDLDPSVAVRDIDAQRSWVFRNDVVEVAVTHRGAHMAPVTFYSNEERPIRPYYVSPLRATASSDGDQPEVFRGDFFCLPYGSNRTPYNGERHPSHGETARSFWSLVGGNRDESETTITLEIVPKVRQGRVIRKLSLVDGQNAVYDHTIIEGFAGKTTMAHHAVLAVPKAERTLLISSSPFVFGMTCPYPLSDPEKGEYQALAVNARFNDLSSVPSMIQKAPGTDCSAFPARRGYSDLLQMWSHPTGNEPAWVAAVNTEERYLWFALKDPKVLPGRILWIENQGRHSAPWNDRINCLGIEDGCMFFDAGIAASCAPNAIAQAGFATCHELRNDVPFAVNYVQGVVRVPRDFGYVRRAKFESDGVRFVSEEGHGVLARVNHRFVFSGSCGAT
jgi:hypothetical protein